MHENEMNENKKQQNKNHRKNTTRQRNRKNQKKTKQIKHEFKNHLKCYHFILMLNAQTEAWNHKKNSYICSRRMRTHRHFQLLRLAVIEKKRTILFHTNCDGIRWPKKVFDGRKPTELNRQQLSYNHLGWHCARARLLVSIRLDSVCAHGQLPWNLWSVVSEEHRTFRM